MTCPLCSFHADEILYSDELFKVVRCLDRKGHRERIMVVSNHHEKTVTGLLFNHAIGVLRSIGRRVFNYTYKFVIMAGTYGSIPEHWHLVASDLDPKSRDFLQVLGTPWIEVVEVKSWK